MTNWTLLQWLEALAYFTATVGACAAAIHFVLKKRRESITSLRTALIRTWTNEGDVTANDTEFLTLAVEDYEGDLVASLDLNSQPRPLDASIDVVWGKALLYVTYFAHRSVFPVATVSLTLSGNNNRLRWKLREKQGNVELPKQTVLWPNPV
jgi:hypothetical protein